MTKQTIPKVRFKEFDENWRKNYLKDIFQERNILKNITDELPLVSFTVENGVTPKTERYDREFLVRNENKKYKLTFLNDIVSSIVKSSATNYSSD
ncbi:hypothetical protein ACVRWQ_03220 [Streptococcus phocae subsp. salmonis]|uniref:hypothetical protein n=1 Tax=Streptococcus phocae TaxID=119224 RepID=UPI0006919C7A|nr:hypothetical protein [Streptococcus phocae]